MISLKITNLQKRYNNVPVFANLNKEINAATLGIAGPNGSGKSTLLKCLAGLLKPNSGTVSWTLNGESLSPVSMTGLLGFAAPYVELYEGMTVYENLEFLLKLHRNHTNHNKSDYTELLERFQAQAFAEKLYGELSTGQRQRVKLASAFIHSPPVILLDEPGSNLDPEGKLLIRRTIEMPGPNQNMVVIASNLAEELELCEEVIDLGQD